MREDTRKFNLPEDRGATAALIPAEFFIDEQFWIVKAHCGTHIDDHLPIDEVRAFAGFPNVFAK